MRAAISALVGLMATMPANVRAQQGVSLGIRYTAGQKTSLHILPIAGAGGDSIARIIARDLDYSDRFTVNTPEPGPRVAPAINYEIFGTLQVQGVVQGTLLPTGYLRIALHDVQKKAVVNQKDFPLISPVNSGGWRMSVHAASDEIEEWITGQRGIAQTQIAFVRDGRIWTVDSDGANAIPRTTRGLSPSWTPNGRQIVYHVLEASSASILVTDLSTGAQRTLTRPQSGVQDITPAVSPDGRSVIFSRMPDGGSDLYRISLTGGDATRITVGRGASNLTPSFSPDGQRIVFTSDRVGNPEVYIADVDGTNAEALTTPTYGERGQRTAPEWSPDGRLIAYTSRLSETYQIMTMNLRDQSVRQVTNDGRNNDPSWAPDSRHIVVTSRRSGTEQLWVHDIETGRYRQLTHGGTSRLAAWSPRLGS